jgi:hypothetical protein
MCTGNCNGGGMKFTSKSNGHSMVGAGRNPFATKSSMPKGWNLPRGGMSTQNMGGGFGTPMVRMSFSSRNR